MDLVQGTAAAAQPAADPVMWKYLEQQDVLLRLIDGLAPQERATVARDWLQHSMHLMRCYLDASLAQSGLAAAPEQSAAEPAAVQAPAAGGTLEWLRGEVARITGHPLAAVTADADLEGELGVDSVTLMELWHLLVQRRPELEARETELLGQRTLRALTQLIDTAAAGADAEPLSWLRKQVAALTGYPLAEVGLDTDLEEELGVDSVSRAELGTALLERYPQQAVEMERLLAARTLREIGGVLSAPAVEATAVTAAAEPAPRRAPAAEGEVQQVLLQVAAALAAQAGARVGADQDWYEELELDPFVVEGLLRGLVAGHPRLSFAGAAITGCTSLAQLGRVLRGLQGDAAPVVTALPLWQQSWEPTLGRTPVTVVAGEHLLLRIGGTAAALANAHELWLDGAVLHDGASALSAAQLLQPQGRWRERLQASGRWTLQVDALASAADELAAQLETLFALVKGLQTVRCPHRLELLLHGGAGPGGAAVRGLFKSLRHEWCGTEVVILNGYERLSAPRLEQRLAEAPAGEELRIDARGRLERSCLQPLSLPGGGAPLLRADDVVLVTGGGRGLGAEMVRELVALAPCRTVVVGRTPLPAAEPFPGEPDSALERLLRAQGCEPHTLRTRLRETEAQRGLHRLRREVEAAGGRFDYVSLDLAQADPAEIAALLRPFGPLNGVIHAAGLTRDARLQLKSLDDFRTVFGAKARAWLALRPYLEMQPLRFAYLVSSLAAVRGTPGQPDYCAANELLNAAAADWATAAEFPVTAVAFAPWTETGLVTPAFRRQMERLGLPGIRNDEGRALLRQLLHTPQVGPWLLASPPRTLDYALGRSAA